MRDQRRHPAQPDLYYFERLLSIADQLTTDVQAERDPAVHSPRLTRLRQGTSALTTLVEAELRREADPPADELSTRGSANPSTANAVPEAIDASGAIRVRYGPDGLPEWFVVDPDWRRLVGVERFAATVEEACRTAVFGPTSELATEPPTKPATPEPAENTPPRPTEAGQDEFARKADSILEYVENGSRLPEDLAGADPGQDRARSLEALLDDVLSLAEAAAAAIPEPLADPFGDRPATRLELIVGPFGLVSCIADPDWLSRRETSDITGVLNEELRRAVEKHRASTTMTMSELAESLATMTNTFAELQTRLRTPDDPR